MRVVTSMWGVVLLFISVTADRTQLMMDQWQVRAFNPTFACTSFDLADLTDLSATKWGMEFNTLDRSAKDSDYVVHHIVLYSCGSKNAMWERYTSGGECIFLELLPSECGSVVWTSQDPMPDNYTSPQGSGITFSNTENRYLIMEIHYENVGFKAGGVDSSGMEIVFSNVMPWATYTFQDFIDAPDSKILGDAIYLPQTDSPAGSSPVTNVPGTTDSPVTSSPGGDPTDGDDDGSSTGLIIALVVAGVVILALAAVLTFVLLKKKQARTSTESDVQDAFVEMKQ